MAENENSELDTTRGHEGAAPERRDSAPSVRVDRPARRRKSRWTAEDAEKYRFVPVPIPEGLDPIAPVRIYSRNSHHYVVFWHPGLAKSVKKRVEGSLTDVYLAAREAQKRILGIQANRPLRRIPTHDGLVREYLGDVEARVESGDVKLPTLRRYRSALRHYSAFVAQDDTARRYPDPTQVDEQFAREFEAFLRQLQVSPNGHANSARRPMRSTDYIVGVVRAMYEWARTRKG